MKNYLKSSSSICIFENVLQNLYTKGKISEMDLFNQALMEYIGV